MDLAVTKHCPVHEAYQFTSPLVSINQFKDQCATLIGDEMFYSDEKNNAEKESNQREFAKLLNTDEQTVAELEEVCSLDNLKCDYEDEYDYQKPRIFQEFPDDNPLQTIRMAKQGKTKMEEPHYLPIFVEPVPEETETDEELVSPGEVLLTVAVFHPEKRKIQQEFYVLPNQKLTEVRDLITCRSDHVIMGEFSSNPNLTGAKTAKELCGSSFFFFEQCFYNDMRNPLNRNYSRLVIEWAKASDRYAVPGLGLFQSKNMEATTFKDLSFRLGYPYLFCHQGNCEHIIVFTDMRIVKEDDPRKVKSYPYKILEAVKRRRRCSICNIHLIKWMTVNDYLAFEDPSFFCEKCFRYLHYSANGERVASFEAYPYIEAD